MWMYLWYPSGIEAENSLVAARIYSCSVAVFLGAHPRVQHAVWMVSAAGQLCTYKQLLTSGAGQSVDGPPDVPVNKDPGRQPLIEAHDVIMYIPAFLSEIQHVQQLHTAPSCL